MLPDMIVNHMNATRCHYYFTADLTFIQMKFLAVSFLQLLYIYFSGYRNIPWDLKGILAILAQVDRTIRGKDKMVNSK